MMTHQLYCVLVRKRDTKGLDERLSVDCPDKKNRTMTRVNRLNGVGNLLFSVNRPKTEMLNAEMFPFSIVLKHLELKNPIKTNTIRIQHFSQSMKQIKPIILLVNLLERMRLETILLYPLLSPTTNWHLRRRERAVHHRTRSSTLQGPNSYGPKLLQRLRMVIAKKNKYRNI